MSHGLLWLRRDLRLADNPALQALLDDGHTPVPVYILDEPDPHWPLGAASAWWLHHSLRSLDTSLREHGSNLLVLRGDSLQHLLQLADSTGAKAVYWNRCYEPACIERDRAVTRALEQHGIEASSHSGALLREPGEQLKQDNTPYRVFTPFWKSLLERGPARTTTASNDRLPAPGGATPDTARDIDALRLLPSIGWDRAFYDHWQPGEPGAWQALQDFAEHGLADYAELRDRPAEPATSRLSAHLHFGEISPLQVWEYLHQWVTGQPDGAYRAMEAWLRQLGWREFSYHLLFHFPHTTLHPLDARFEQFPWQTDYHALLSRWQQGQTGIPLVDAGMRELWHTGYMHNRVRMIVASFLTKNLRIPWQEGARWFWDTLVDADLANNTAGWQWTAGCGADAAPYFRVFNPILQGEKFDGRGEYVRRWIPELAGLPDRYIHQPHAAPSALLEQAGVIPGKTYPEPIIDLRASRQAALDAWQRVKQR